MCKYAVVDLEMCRVPKSARTKEFHYSNEIIQIGAVLMDENYEIIDRFDTYVSPEFGFIDSFIENLTGIAAKDVIDAPKFADAIATFEQWLPEDVQMVEWSNSDQAQIRYEIRGKKIEVSRSGLLLDTPWVDCQRMFGENIEFSRSYNLTEALNLSDIDYMNGAHNGYVDAYNTALLFAKLKKTPKAVLDAYYDNIGINKKPLGSCLGDLFAGLRIQYYA